MEDSVLEIIESQFSKNSARYSGGAIHLLGISDVSFVKSTFSENSV